MTITIRHTCDYEDVVIHHEGTRIELGLLDDDERRRLAAKLIEAAGQLMDKDA